MPKMPSRPVSDPRFLKARAALEKAVSYQQQGDLVQSEKAYRRVLEKAPDYFDALHFYGLFKYQQGQFNDALKLLSKATKINPRSANALNSLGVVLGVVGHHADATASFDSAIALDPNHVPALSNRGNSLNELRRHQDAISSAERALAINASYFEAYVPLGAALLAAKRYAEALASYEHAIRLNPSFAIAWVGRGNALVELKRYDDAIATYDKAAALMPGLVQVWLGRGHALFRLNRHGDALTAYDQALAIKPDLAEAHLGRGNVFAEINRLDEAGKAYEHALALKSNLAEAWAGCGRVLTVLQRYDEAIDAYDKAQAFDPELAESWLGRGTALLEMKRYAEAISAYDRAIALKPDVNYAEGSRLHAKQQICDWSNWDADWRHLLSATRRGIVASDPFAFLAGPTTLADQLICAKIYTSDRRPTGIALLWRGERYFHDRLRVGYLSADFRSHPVAQGVAELLEWHDRSRFEIIGLSIGPDDGSEIRARIVKAFDQFHDVQMKSDVEAARLIKALEVDVLVKVAPHTEGSRLGILAHRPAPIQVNGFSAWTSGADFIDYVLADPRTLPFDEQRHFSEQIVHVPDSYFPQDSTQQIAADTPSRAEAGLPDDGFVFCSFNRSYKLNPRTFDIWMRLLKRVDGSVLWLMQDNDRATVNLRREATMRDIDPSRLVFAARMPQLSNHLARHRLADLFLDTLPFGAHTTARDALWAGLPVLTCRGDTFVGRIAASQLHAVGLPDLVTDNLDEYEAAALRLTQNPDQLRALRDRLAANRLSHALFDTARLCRHFEAAYTEMTQRHQRGEPPQSFAVKRQ